MKLINLLSMIFPVIKRSLRDKEDVITLQDEEIKALRTNFKATFAELNKIKTRQEILNNKPFFEKMLYDVNNMLEKLDDYEFALTSDEDSLYKPFFHEQGYGNISDAKNYLTSLRSRAAEAKTLYNNAKIKDKLNDQESK